MDTFNDANLTPDQLKMLTLQFMGQNIGEIKELDRNVLTKTNSLNGMTLNPDAVLNSIPSLNINQPQPVAHQQPTIPASTPSLTLQPVESVSVVPVVEQTNNKDQLEFNFENSPLSQQIFDKLATIEDDIRKLRLTQNEILSILKSTQKEPT
jgi:hypothetical protein